MSHGESFPSPVRCCAALLPLALPLKSPPTVAVSLEVPLAGTRSRWTPPRDHPSQVREIAADDRSVANYRRGIRWAYARRHRRASAVTSEVLAQSL